MLIYLQIIENSEGRWLFERLYKDYKRIMLSAARQIVKNKADAEDAVHQAFMYLAGNMNKVGKIEEGKRKAFLLLISEHKALDIVRQNSRVIPMEDPENLPGLPVSMVTVPAKLQRCTA